MLQIPRSIGLVVTRRFGVDFVTIDEVKMALATVVHGTDLLDVLDLYVRVGLVLAKEEVRPRFLAVPPLRESDTPVLGVVRNYPLSA